MSRIFATRKYLWGWVSTFSGVRFLFYLENFWVPYNILWIEEEGMYNIGRSNVYSLHNFAITSMGGRGPAGPIRIYTRYL